MKEKKTKEYKIKKTKKYRLTEKNKPLKRTAKPSNSKMKPIITFD